MPSYGWAASAQPCCRAMGLSLMWLQTMAVFILSTRRLPPYRAREALPGVRGYGGPEVKQAEKATWPYGPGTLDGRTGYVAGTAGERGCCLGEGRPP